MRAAIVARNAGLQLRELGDGEGGYLVEVRSVRMVLRIDGTDGSPEFWRRGKDGHVASTLAPLSDVVAYPRYSRGVAPCWEE